jgi:hypothetical protein
MIRSHRTPVTPIVPLRLCTANKKTRMTGTKKSRTSAARAKAIATSVSADDSTRAIGRAASVGARLIHFGIIWVVAVGFTFIAAALRKRVDPSIVEGDGNSLLAEVPLEIERLPAEKVDAITNGSEYAMLGNFGSYPNLLNITEEERNSFHPVVKFPKIWMETEEGGERIKKQVLNYQVLDLTSMSGADQLASEEERMERRAGKKSPPQELKGFAVGRYDENRAKLYSSALFDDTSNTIDGFAGARTVHIGIDLDGPLGTKVFSFANGIVHKVGYNAELGDYGNVIVIEHSLRHGDDGGSERKIYALYGHLDGKSTKGKKEGQKIKKGQLLGRMGDIHENGGW